MSSAQRPSPVFRTPHEGTRLSAGSFVSPLPHQFPYGLFDVCVADGFGFAGAMICVCVASAAVDGYITTWICDGYW